MNKEEAKDLVIKLTAEKAGIEVREINKDTEQKFDNDLGLDSLDVIDIAMSIESEINIAIPDHDLEDILTVQHLIDLVTRIVTTGK